MLDPGVSVCALKPPTPHSDTHFLLRSASSSSSFPFNLARGGVLKQENRRVFFFGSFISRPLFKTDGHPWPPPQSLSGGATSHPLSMALASASSEIRLITPQLSRAMRSSSR